ncbi:HAMP domain-containing sensor histidine kinase [Flavobacterium sp. SUN046]|nr:HAMP domain-containing sensor histidine kinase [Flavobacterium sp. SUN046]MEC4048827.1 HAMP domain-containing sensor histidine kinase [Flavobacterium sp. SUN046]
MRPYFNSPQYQVLIGEKQSEVRLRKEQNQLVFRVADTGKGIESRYKAKVFDKYFQVPGSQKSGIGSGLAISREFIEAQKGSIGVDSELGLGSTFYFKLMTV